jgi:hypothetical protein
LALHEHVRRVLGVDLTGPLSGSALNAPYTVPAMEVLSRGLLTPGMAERLAGAVQAAGAAAGPESAAASHDEEAT